MRRSKAGGGFERIVPGALVAALAAVALLASSALGAGSASDSIAKSFGPYSRGEDKLAPGRALRSGEEAPAYFRAGRWSRTHVHNPRVLAEAGGYKLYAYRGTRRQVHFDLGDTGVGVGFPGMVTFRQTKLFVLGSGSFAQHVPAKLPYFGLASEDVETVKLTYATGPSLEAANVGGGFVLLAAQERKPQALLALGAEGEVLARVSIPSPARTNIAHTCPGALACPRDAPAN